MSLLKAWQVTMATWHHHHLSFVCCYIVVISGSTRGYEHDKNIIISASIKMNPGDWNIYLNLWPTYVYPCFCFGNILRFLMLWPCIISEYLPAWIFLINRFLFMYFLNDTDCINFVLKIHFYKNRKFGMNVHETSTQQLATESKLQQGPLPP